ncbi:hypothetical protein ACE1AT_11065 [Pelatocladus sp. BLCC-F211]|uniref:hypothetical protein n=1 Tax=Pelatocladus sp. BLCC-F211 TaxID=3342752 RepID=UPI0035B8DE7C
MKLIFLGSVFAICILTGCSSEGARSLSPSKPKLISSDLTYEDLQILEEQKGKEIEQITQEYKDCIVKYRQKSKCEYITVKAQSAWDERMILNKRMADMLGFDVKSKLCELKPGSSECDEAQKLKQKLADLNNYK